jgi:hypothetical protein
MALAEGAPETARGHLETALAAMEGAGARFEAARTRLPLAQAVHRLGDPGAAAELLARAREVFIASRAPLYVERTQALARELGPTG